MFHASTSNFSPVLPESYENMHVGLLQDLDLKQQGPKVGF